MSFFSYKSLFVYDRFFDNGMMHSTIITVIYLFFLQKQPCRKKWHSVAFLPFFFKNHNIKGGYALDIYIKLLLCHSYYIFLNPKVNYHYGKLQWTSFFSFLK